MVLDMLFDMQFEMLFEMQFAMLFLEVQKGPCGHDIASTRLLYGGHIQSYFLRYTKAPVGTTLLAQGFDMFNRLEGVMLKGAFSRALLLERKWELAKEQMLWLGGLGTGPGPGVPGAPCALQAHKQISREQQQEGIAKTRTGRPL